MFYMDCGDTPVSGIGTMRGVRVGIYSLTLAWYLVTHDEYCRYGGMTPVPGVGMMMGERMGTWQGALEGEVHQQQFSICIRNVMQHLTDSSKATELLQLE